ncbi:hypothetical protein F2Q69_00036590 [Brassica cretica]|uniref:Uncharacterized protein n=1 Tax=Brassica cretica TaxID=69181 RepID=A0A8S9SLU5_BRACR|nr:hypothetical protein F2Q69_00036590 [Brassica cretica]
MMRRRVYRDGSWKVEGEDACSHGSRACGLSFTEVEWMIIIEKVCSRYCNSISSRFILTSGHLLIEEVVARRAAKLFSSSCSKLSKTLIATFWSLRSVHDDIQHPSGLRHIDVELAELGRSCDQHSSSVCYGLRVLLVKLVEYRTPYEMSPFSCLQTLDQVPSKDVFRFSSPQSAPKCRS